MGRAGFEPALLYQELGPKPSAYANFATCPFFLSDCIKTKEIIAVFMNLLVSIRRGYTLE